MNVMRSPGEIKSYSQAEPHRDMTGSCTIQAPSKRVEPENESFRNKTIKEKDKIYQNWCSFVHEKSYKVSYFGQ